MDGRLLDGIEAAYQGEVLGEVLYEAIAAAQSDPDRRWKWQLLAQMERETGALTAAALGRLGRPVRPDPAARAEGLRQAADYGAMDWVPLMDRFARELEEDIAAYVELSRRAGGAEAATLGRLVAHEVVTRAFCRDEAAGRDGIGHVLALVADPPPRP